MSQPPEVRQIPGRPTPDRWFLTLLFLMAVGLRIAAIVAIVGLATPPEVGSDEEEYDSYAWNVAQGRGYRGLSVDVSDQDHFTAYRPPVPALFYAAIFAVSGHSFAMARIANALLGGLTVLLIHAIGRRCFDIRVARIAATVFAFAPAGIFFGLGLIAEPIAAFLVALVVWCSLGIRDERGWLWAVATGVSFGLLLLTKPGFLFVALLMPFWAAIVCGRRWGDWCRVASIPVIMGLVMLPWVIRNLLVMGAFIPFGTSGGQLLLSTCNRVVVDDPNLYGYSAMDNYLPEYRPSLRAADDEFRRDAIAKKFAIEWLRANPDKWFYLVRGKFARFWEPWLHREKPRLIDRAVEMGNVLILIFMAGALPGVTVRFWRERNPGLIIQAMLLGNTIMAVIFHGQPRYRFPIESLCMLLASSGLVGLVDHVRAAGGVAGALEVFGRGLIRHKVAIIITLVAGAGFTMAVQIDEQKIEAYRDQVCENQLREIGRALSAYETAEGRMPASLADLVPRYLPTVGGLHCPRHSLGWNDYIALSETDPAKAAFAISYSLVIEPGATRSYLIEEIEPRHHGLKKSRRYPESAP